MKGTPLILLAVMVIFASFAFVMAESVNETNQSALANLPWISPSVYEALNKSEWVSVGVFVNSIDVIDNIIHTLPENDFQLERRGAENLSFFVGNITRKGLDILANNSNVSRIIYERWIPVASDNPQNQTNLTVSVFIDPQVPLEFEKSEWVYVGVPIKDTSGIYIDPKWPKEEKINLSLQKEEYNRKIQEQIVADLSKEEFNLTRISRDGLVFMGT